MKRHFSLSTQYKFFPVRSNIWFGDMLKLNICKVCDDLIHCPTEEKNSLNFKKNIPKPLKNEFIFKL